MTNIDSIAVAPDVSLEEALAVMQRGGVGFALVLASDRRLLGTMTDGDIRRAILKKLPLSTSLSTVFKDRPPGREPTTASLGTPPGALLSLMQEKDVRHIPLLDAEGRVQELVLLSELLVEHPSLPLVAVVMAGGEGQRLRPLTAAVPKPMLPLHDRPLMHRTIEQLHASGVRHVTIATHYKSDVIKGYFGDGSSFGVDIRYVEEDRPLGTAGALGLMEVPKTSTLVINGDIVTGLDFRTMLDFHRSHKSVLTVGVRILEISIPYGVIETEDVCVTRLTEKPSHVFTVNAGIYLLEPEVYAHIPVGERIHMTELVERLLQSGRRVVSFPIQEYWLDIGHHADYQKANEDAKSGKV